MSLTGAFFFLLLGLVELMAVQKLVYPALRWKHEEAKVTGTQGRDPVQLMTLIRFQSLVLMPIIGLLFGKSFGGIFG